MSRPYSLGNVHQLSQAVHIVSARLQNQKQIMHLPWVDFWPGFLVCEGLKNRSAISQCYYKKLSQEENFHSYQQIDRCETPKNLC